MEIEKKKLKYGKYCIYHVCLFLGLFYVCVFKGHIPGSFCLWRQGAQISHYYISGLRETLSYNVLRPRELISFKGGFLFWECPVDSKQQTSFGISSTVYDILLVGQRCWNFYQYNLQNRLLQLSSNPALYWGR